MVFDGLGASGDPELQLAGVAAETGQQRIAGNVGGRVFPAPGRGSNLDSLPSST